MSNGTSITLEYPVTVDGLEYQELFMRRPKMRDQIKAKKGKGTDADKEIVMFADLCEAPPDVIKELDIADYYRLQDTFQDFLPQKKKSEEES